MSETVGYKPAPFEATAKSMLSSTGAKQLNSSFDPSTHKPFTLDHRGMNKEVTMKDLTLRTQHAKEEVKIPSWWQKNGPNKTLTDL